MRTFKRTPGHYDSLQDGFVAVIIGAAIGWALVGLVNLLIK